MILAPQSEIAEHASPSVTRLIVRICILQSLCFLLLMFVFVTVVARFEKIFKDFDAELPTGTIVALDLSHWFRSYWYLCALASLAIMFVCGMLCKTGCPTEARWINRIVCLGTVLILAFVALAMALPLIGITQKLT